MSKPAPAAKKLTLEEAVMELYLDVKIRSNEEVSFTLRLSQG